MKPRSIASGFTRSVGLAAIYHCNYVYAYLPEGMGSQVTAALTNIDFPSGPRWTLSIDHTFDVLGPFPINAREQHFLSPAFPVDLRLPLDLNARWTSSYADGGEVTWEKRTMPEEGCILLSYPNIRWSQLRATEGWAALQHHSIIRVRLTTNPTDAEMAQSIPIPQLSARLLRGSFFCLLPVESHPDRANIIPQWHSGDIYAMGGLPSLIRLPVPPSPQQATSYDLFISADYEIRLFGDSRSSGSEAPILDMALSLELVPLFEHVVREHALDVVCDFVDGFAFGDAVGVGVRSIAGWWGLKSAKLVHAIPEFEIHLAGGPISFGPGQARVVPIRISQLLAVKTLGVLEIELALENVVAGVTFMLAKLDIRHRSLGDDMSAITASYFFASSMPTAFLAKPPSGSTPLTNQSHAPVLALHGAGVDILSQSFWSDALPTQKQSWVVIPTGRTPWGLDWHGPSAHDAWLVVDALKKIVNTRSEWFGWRLPSDHRVAVIGHSNGGQGAWYLASRWPDRVLAAIAAAGYIKAQAYVPLTQSRSAHFVDPVLRAILESAFTPDDNDLFSSNVAHTPILAIHGGDDDNVPAWHTREAVADVKSWNPSADISYIEDQGKGHWYPGIFQRSEVQKFLQTHLQSARRPTVPRRFTLTAIYPYEGSSFFGWKILAVRTSGRLARLSVVFDATHATIMTSNIRAFHVGQVHDPAQRFQIDGHTIKLSGKEDIEYNDGGWKQAVYANTTSRKHYRMASILESAAPLKIIIPENATSTQLSAALRIAHSLQLFHKLDSEIIPEPYALNILRSKNISSTSESVGNIIAIGTSASAFSRHVLRDSNDIHRIVGNTLTSQPNDVYLNHEDGMMMLHRHPESAIAAALFLIAEDDAALERLTRLFPVRTGIPIPDWILVSPFIDSAGTAGVKSTGVLDEHWNYNEAMAWCN